MKQNTENEIAEWVDNYTQELYSWAFHKVSNAELAQDLVQDTFLAAVEKLDNFRRDSSPKTWLFTILNHKIIDYYRKKVNQPIGLDSYSFSTFFDASGSWQETRRPQEWQDDDEQHLLDDTGFQKVLQNCLDALPDNWNMAVKLKYLSDKKGEDICQELGVTPSNFWQIVHRAKLQLRDCVDKNWSKN